MVMDSLCVFPKLKGWRTIPEAGLMLNRSRKRVYQMVLEGKFDVVRTIGTKNRLIYLIADASLRRYAQGRGITLVELCRAESDPEISAADFNLAPAR